MKATDLIFFPLRLIDQALSMVTGQGSWSLRPYERRLIEAAAAGLSPGNRAILEKQLQASFFVLREHRGRMTNIHFRWRDEVKRLDVPDDARLAKLRLTQGRKSVTVSVEAHRGLIFGLHYSKSPKPLVAGDFAIAVIAQGGRGDDKLARALDRSEHDEGAGH